MDKWTERVLEYWTRRAHDFGTVRKNELKSELGRLWLREMNVYLPRDRRLDILDVGTGTGYFALLLAGEGHRLTGIDLTPAMLAEAEDTAREYGREIRFLQRDAQDTGFTGESFDAIVTRNLTWTLPEPEKAYGEWHRLLRKGGVLLNFDACYADNVRNQNQSASYISPSGTYGHIGVTPELARENAEITLAMPAGSQRRPRWDLALVEKLGFSSFGADETAGARILGERDLSDAPLFLLWAVK
jgi:SAM-dependent methyltransferase